MTDPFFLTVPLPRLPILASRRWCRPGRLEARKPHPSGNLERESHQARRIHRRPGRRQKGVARNDFSKSDRPGKAAVKEVRDHVRTSVKKFADNVRKATGIGGHKVKAGDDTNGDS